VRPQTDEALRQINSVPVLQAGHENALTMLAQVYRLKALYPQSIETAQRPSRWLPGMPGRTYGWAEASGLPAS
jgi:hypothetical protein